MAALQRTKDVYDALEAGSTSVPHTVADGRKSVSDRLAKVSKQLEDQYSAARVAWCEKTFGEVDVVCGQGGDVSATGVQLAPAARLL